MRTIYRAFDACPNLRIELSGYWLYRGIEYITRTWGPERLLYGSNWPTFGPHMTLATLTCAEIDDEAKRRIAGDNLRELVAAGVRHRHPLWDERAVEREVIRLMIGDELFRRAYGKGSASR